MDLLETQYRAISLIGEYLPKDWTFSYHKRIRELGNCSYKEKQIQLSKKFVETNEWVQIKDILLHEIAHALVGPGNGHNQVFQKKAKEIGCQEIGPRSKYDIPGKYYLVCPNRCGFEVRFYRKPKKTKGRACADCCNKYNRGIYMSKYQLVLTDKSGKV